jgi:hypothetical protein
MAEKIFLQESKEFQMKVVWPPPGRHKKPVPGATDQQIFKLVETTIRDVVSRLAGGKKGKSILDDTPWRREGIRYDTADWDLRQNNLTLAIEATDEKTKLKCKQHHFIPELLYKRPKHSTCYPAVKAASCCKEHGAKLKLEEDIVK